MANFGYKSVTVASGSMGALGKRKRRNRLKANPADMMRRLRRALVGLSALAFLSASGVWVYKLLEPQTFPIRMIQVNEGLRHVEHAVVVERVEPHAAVGFFRADVNAIQRAVTALPWVREATVRRIWPDTLRVSVVEQEAFAKWLPSGLLNDAAERFTPLPETYPEGLPELSGPQGTEALVVSRYRALRALLLPLGTDILRLSINERRAMRLRLSNGLELLLGRGDGTRALGRFVQAYTRVLAPRVAEVERVDLRYTNGFAVRWRLASAAAEPAPGEAL